MTGEVELRLAPARDGPRLVRDGDGWRIEGRVDRLTGWDVLWLSQTVDVAMAGLVIDGLSGRR